MSTVAKNVQDLIHLITDINDHPSRDTALVSDCVLDGVSRRYLSRDEDGIPTDLVKLIEELEVRLDNVLITQQGTHSDEYYLLSKQPGIKTVVLEKDSFGPLIVGIKHIDGNWWVTYG